MKVFFYGLFMDEAVLASKGITPSGVIAGYVEDLQLRIGERATLLHQAGERAFGLVMEIAPDDLAALYSEPSVADYVAEPLLVHCGLDAPVTATCYNLPAEKVTGVNTGYADALLALASRLGFPDTYLEQIRNAGKRR